MNTNPNFPGVPHRPTMIEKLSERRFEIILFVFVWLIIGVTINSRNLTAFNLQQMGVESIVQRNVFWVEGSASPTLQPIGDVFDYQGHKYAAKQPGQFMFGAVCYFFLHLFGLDYVRYYLMTSGLVTFLSAGFITAVSAVALYRTVQLLSKAGSSGYWPSAVALLYVFGTTVFPYAGIAHHDTIASAFLVIAFYLAVDLAHGPSDKGGGRWRITITGLFLGLIVTTSMLAFWPAIAIGLYFVSIVRWNRTGYVCLGLMLGLLPLFFYDTVNFGNPLLLPNFAGNYSDTFFHFTVSNFIDKAGFYLKGAILYAPIILMGACGTWFLPRPFIKEKLGLAAAAVILCGYIFNIDSVGTCEYGPRYLLPVMGLACIGFCGFTFLENAAARYLSMLVFFTAGAFGVVINFVGALGGAMYCDLANHAFWPHFNMIQKGELGTFPLATLLLIPSLIAGYFFIRNIPGAVERSDLEP